VHAHTYIDISKNPHASNNAIKLLKPIIHFYDFAKKIDLGSSTFYKIDQCIENLKYIKIVWCESIFSYSDTLFNSV